jgi:hypothetical protein
MKDLHEHYSQLTPPETKFVDQLIRHAFAEAKALREAGDYGPPLIGDDRCEEAVDALAKWVIESRSADE